MNATRTPEQFDLLKKIVNSINVLDLETKHLVMAVICGAFQWFPIIPTDFRALVLFREVDEPPPKSYDAVFCPHPGETKRLFVKHPGVALAVRLTQRNIDTYDPLKDVMMVFMHNGKVISVLLSRIILEALTQFSPEPPPRKVTIGLSEFIEQCE